jgi:ribosome recycling factor
MTISELLNEAKAGFDKAYTHLTGELAGLQVGRASAAMVEGLQIDSYGAHQPLRNLANISVPDARTLAIQPWDRSTLQSIEKAIRDSSLGLNPNNDGLRILLNIPPLTEERRRDLTKVVGSLAEEARIGVRRIRQEILGRARRAADGDDAFTEDDEKVFEKKLQTEVDSVNQRIEELAKKKEAEVMKV